MITLDATSVTTTSATRGGKTITSTTDTLVVSYVELQLEAGTILAIIKRGTIVDGKLVESEPALWVNVNADGTFASRDGAWCTISTSTITRVGRWAGRD